MPHDLIAFIDAAIDEPVSIHEHAVAGFTLELAYDDWGILAATWRRGAWWQEAEVGDG